MNKSKILSVFFLLISQVIIADYANREAQYDAEFTAALEIAYGDGHMGNGGQQTVQEIFKNIPLANKSMPDFRRQILKTYLY